jgi:hypothetical protein
LRPSFLHKKFVDRTFDLSAFPPPLLLTASCSWHRFQGFSHESVRAVLPEWHVLLGGGILVLT